MSKIGRNVPCPCGSGKKFKKCCARLASTGAGFPEIMQALQMTGSQPASTEDSDPSAHFAKTRSDLKAIFTAYDAEDVILAIAVSDLWLPNISSQIKHLFALGVLLEITPEEFRGGSKIVEYETFCGVVRRLYEVLPTFPAIEDYVPEADWGEIRSTWPAQTLRLFYGSQLERVPDFIDAFRLTNTANIKALNDLYTANLLQHRILSAIDASLIGDASEISPGHLEIPSRTFWQVCREAIREVGHGFTDHERVSTELILDLGTFKFPASFSEFSNAVFTGQLLPALFVRTQKGLLPLSPRNSIVNVIDYWGDRSTTLELGEKLAFTRQLSDFLAKRVDHRSIIPGPAQISSNFGELQESFAAVLRADKHVYFVVALDTKRLERLAKIEIGLKRLVTSSSSWRVKIDRGRREFEFHAAGGNRLKPEQIVVLAVLPQGSTTAEMIRIPKTQSAHVVPVSELISIFDSIESMAEFERFDLYLKETQRAMLFGFINFVDRFAAFRESHGVLIAGAFEPDMVMLDPHGGSSWRYEELKKFWSTAPAFFPDDDPRSWRIRPGQDGIVLIESKTKPVHGWTATVNSCTIIILHGIHFPSTEIDIRVLELFAHCTADALHRIRTDVAAFPIFRRRRITVELRANPKSSASDPPDQQSDLPLLQNWERLGQGSNDTEAHVGVMVNLSLLLKHFENPVDDRFEIDSALSVIQGVGVLLGEPLDAAAIANIRSGERGKPRFTLMRRQRVVDVPDFLNPQKPTPAMFKLARRRIAIIFRENDVTPERYELTEAKRVIDIARDLFRDQLHRRIARFQRESVLAYCIGQIDAWLADWERTRHRLRLSLKHDVSYDRSQAFAKANREFIDASRNLRFLLECCLSMPQTAQVKASENEVLQLVADVDWLLVLYSASDVLHNGIAPGGIEIDDQFVPRVFYNDEQVPQEAAFTREQADYDLGINLDPSTEAMTITADLQASLDEAFLKDVQISFTHLMAALSVLMQWQSYHGRSDLQLYYRATESEIKTALCSFIDGLGRGEADHLVAFLTLQPREIRRLIGKDIDEADVPIWEHNKRSARYTIKPLVPMEDGTFMWGAACTEKAQSIWGGSISQGFLPADYHFPSVQRQVRKIKQSLESDLEKQALTIVSKYTPFVLGGIDFKRRFPREEFEDVGDFDTLAYWPQQNKWLICECKYNQPPFCLKDARRLRERIFGISPDRGHFAKIERRTSFLSDNLDRIHRLVQWPTPVPEASKSIDELYITRQIFWWMRFPPYKVTTQFVRIDNLNAWMNERGYNLL